MTPKQVCDHIYSYRPRNPRAERRQTAMNIAFIKAAIIKVKKGTEDKA